MAALDSFGPPGNLDELSEEGRAGWTDRVSAVFSDFAGFEQFLDPTVSDLAEGHETHVVEWVAFPADLLRSATSEEGRWQAADSSRSVQDEYCEWAVQRDQDDKLTRVTFTTETPEYYRQLFETDQARLLEVYEQFTGQQVSIEDLRGRQGRYLEANQFNQETSGTIAHLVQTDNTLGAAVRLAAEATILREREGVRITDQQELVICGGLGNPFRNSDPQIAAAVNNLAADGAEITLADPPGLYIHRFSSAGLRTPDGANAADFWTIERGEPGLALRASFEVPAEHGYTISDITASGRPIRFGAQLADRVRIKLRAIASPGAHTPEPQPCVS